MIHIQMWNGTENNLILNADNMNEMIEKLKVAQDWQTHLIKLKSYNQDTTARINKDRESGWYYHPKENNE